MLPLVLDLKSAVRASGSESERYLEKQIIHFFLGEKPRSGCGIEEAWDEGQVGHRTALQCPTWASESCGGLQPPPALPGLRWASLTHTSQEALKRKIRLFSPSGDLCVAFFKP